jgi:hypothetical protein
MKISFELDGTLLADPSVQKLAESLNRSGFKFFWDRKKPYMRPMILTKRSEDDATDINFKKMLDQFGFSVNDVVFTNGRSKAEIIDEEGIDLHFDNSPDEVQLINKNCKNAKAVLVGYYG